MTPSPEPSARPAPTLRAALMQSFFTKTSQRVDDSAASSALPAMPASSRACACSVFDGTLPTSPDNSAAEESPQSHDEAQTLAFLASLADACVEGRPGHAERVARLSAKLAIAAGMGEGDAAMLSRAARLLDIGFLAVPKTVLAKKGPLTECERAEIDRHALAGAALLSRFQSPEARLAQRIAAHHHEWWNGSGYPQGLVDHSIPLAARIVAVVDVYEALVSPRAGRNALSSNEALALLEDRAGIQFDPLLVRRFVDLMRGDFAALS